MFNDSEKYDGVLGPSSSEFQLNHPVRIVRFLSYTYLIPLFRSKTNYFMRRPVGR